MANITQMLAALAALPQQGGAPTLPPALNVPAPIIPNLPASIQLPPFRPELTQPPPAPQEAIDPRIIAQFQSLIGQPPTPPTIQPASILDKISAALGGVSAGLQGRGGEFASGLREQRQRPQREFERRREEFESRRIEATFAGTREAIRQAENKRAEQDARAQRQFNVEVARRERELGFEDETARDNLRAAIQAERDARLATIAEQKQAREAQKQAERDARLIAREERRGGATPKTALEIGRFEAGLSDRLSPEAEKFQQAQARLAQIRANRAAAGGGGGGAFAGVQKTLQEFNGLRDQLIGAIGRNDFKMTEILRGQVEQSVKRLLRFPAMFDFSADAQGVPTVTPKGAGAGQGQSSAEPRAISDLRVILPGAFPGVLEPPITQPRTTAAPPIPQRGNFRGRTQAKAKLIREGFSPAEAEAELNRLGIR